MRRRNPKADDTVATVEPRRDISLTYQRMITQFQADKQKAIQATPEFETTEMGMRVLEKGKVKLTNGIPEVVVQTVLKRDVVAAQWDERITRFNDRWVGVKG